MRAIDIFGVAVAVVIALLSLIVEPWSTPWWCALTVAAIIAMAAASHMLSNAAGRPQLFMVIFGTSLIIIGGGVGLVGAFQMEVPTSRGPLSDLTKAQLRERVIAFAQTLRVFERSRYAMNSALDEECRQRVLVARFN
jgi:chromate transport protein ChrA